MRLAVVTTHPIQYYAPLFRLLAQEPGLDLHIFYTWSQSEQGPKYDRDFGKIIEWDIPLLEGYSYEFVPDTAKEPGVGHFSGIVNPELNKKIADWHPDFLLVIGWNFRSHLSSMRHFKGKIPILFRGDSTLLDERPGIKKILRRLFLKWVYQHADYGLYVGERNKEYFLKHGLQESHLFRVPHTVDNDRFRGSGKEDIEASQWRKELGFNDNDLVLLFAGKLEPKKDPDFLWRLAKNVADRRLKLMIVGNGISEKELKEKSKGDARIVFLDFQNQQKMPLVYRLCDIFVLPSVGPGESWGLAVNEAMACGRPVIVSTKCGCAPDLVQEHKTGWTFEPGEEGDRQVKELIEKLLVNRNEVTLMGKQAEMKIASFSYAVAIEHINQLLHVISQE